MNKILTIIKNLLLLVNIILLIILCKTIPSYGLDVVLYTFILGFTILVSIKDIIQKNEINKKYNVLFIISELMVIFIFMRTLYDPAFIYNSTKHMKTISDL